MAQLRHVLIALSFFAVIFPPALGQDNSANKPPAAQGEIVSETGKSVMYVFQAKNNTYWFGSNDQGVYRYDGKTLVNFTMKDGLVSNCIRGIQEDKAGNIYFTTYEGISKFDGKSFTTLSVMATSPDAEWKLQPDDLWFFGPSDSGTAYRYDGKSLYQLALPKTKPGEDHIANHPRSLYPNIKYSPYDVYHIFKDSKGHRWFCTAMLGACRYDGKSFTWIPEEELHNGSFGTRSIIEDKDGKFWFCNSLHRYVVEKSDSVEPRFKPLEGIRTVSDPKKAMIVGIMSAILDDTGALWMATYGTGVWRFDGTKTSHYPVKDGKKDITLFSIYKDNQGGLWLGTHEAGAYKFNGKTFEKFRP